MGLRATCAAEMKATRKAQVGFSAFLLVLKGGCAATCCHTEHHLPPLQLRALMAGQRR